MNKTEILNIANEPSKHIHIVKIDGKDSIVYSSKFVDLLELIPTMLTKDDIVTMLEELQLEIEKKYTEIPIAYSHPERIRAYTDILGLIQQKINAVKENIDDTRNRKI